MSRLVLRWLRPCLLTLLLVTLIGLTPGVSAAVNVGCSVSALINALNAATNGTVLNLAAGCNYVLTTGYGVTGAGLPPVNVTLTINGGNAVIQRSTASGTPNFRLFTVGSGGNLTFNLLVLSNGASSSGGGAIYVDHGSLTVNNSIFTNNTDSNFGGAIYNNLGNLTLNGTTFAYNTAATYSGGAIYNNLGSVMVNTSIFAHNGAITYGGGIENDGTLTVSNSTMYSNLVGQEGGAIENDGTLTVSNSTFVQNETVAANGLGGAINNQNTEMATVSNSTFYGNLSGQYGGAISNGSGTVKLGSSILAGDMADTSGPDLSGSITSLGYNVIGDTSGATLTGNTAADLTNAAASPVNLGPVVYNGGPTPTMALGAGSVAIDHGNCATLSGVPAVITDQRGYVRKSPCDAGAYETGTFLPAPLTVGNTYQDDNVNVIYSGIWGTVNGGSYNGGAMHFTGQHDAALSFSLTGSAGNRLTIIRSTGPDRGDMQVCIGAGVCETFSNYSLVPLYQQLLTILLPNTGTFTVSMTNLGSAGQYMDFDAVSLAASPTALTVGSTFEDDSSAISYSGQWISSSSASYSSGTVEYTGFPNNSYTYLINGAAGSRVRIIRTVGADKGDMRVCFSEVFACQTVSNSNPVTLYQQPFITSIPWSGTYPVTVTFTGSSGQYLDVDALTLRSAPTILTVGSTFQDISPNLTYNGVWINNNNAAYDGGSVQYTGQNGASVSFTVTVAAGNKLQILRTASPDHGLMQLCIGVQCTTFSNYGLPTAYQQPLNILMPNAGTFAITLTNLGSGGTPYLDFNSVSLSGSPAALNEGPNYQESSSALIYSGQWISSFNANYSGSQVYYTSQPDSTVTFMVNATAGHYLVLYRTKGGDKGPMEVCFSQIYNCQIISNSSGSIQYQQPISIPLPWTGVYPVTVRFTGSIGQYMDIDAVKLSSVMVLGLEEPIPPEVTEIVTPTEEGTEPPTPEVTDTVMPTEEGTESPTLEVTDTVTPLPTDTPMPFPTLELPTALPFPTLELPSPEPPTPEPLLLPAYASMDDGAPDWTALSGWILTPQAGFGGQGLGWQVTADNQADVLRWNRALDLSNIQPGQTVQLSFESLLSSTQSTGLVQVSADGVNWTTVGTALPVGQWTQMTYDLSGFVGQQIKVQFVWQGVAGDREKPDSWWVDEVRVASLTPASSEPTLTPTLALTDTPAPVVTEAATPEPRNSVSDDADSEP